MEDAIMQLLLQLLAAVSCQYQLEPINNTVGIYYQEEGKIEISNRKWTLLVYKDVQPIREALDHNNKILNNMLNFLNLEHTPIKAFYASVKTHISLLEQISESLNLKFEEVYADTKRYKRGVFNGIGTIFKSITGNLDSSDGEYYNDCINKLNRDEHQLETLLKNQISVTTSVIQSFNSTIQKFKVDEETFNNDINQIQKALIEITDEINVCQTKDNPSFNNYPERLGKLTPNIPLTEPDWYTLYRLYPIPILDNRTGLHHILGTSQRYIAKNDDSLLYVPLQDTRDCKRLMSNVKLCTDLLPYPIDSDAICEAQLLRPLSAFPKTCQSNLIFAKDYGVQRLVKNQWLITISDPLPVTIKCPDREVVSKSIDTNSILKLQPNCNAFIGITRVHAEPYYESNNFTYDKHHVLIPYDCCEHLPEKHELPKLEPLKLSKLNTDDLDVAKHKLDQYSDELNKLIDEPFITKHISWFIYLTITLLICLIVLYTFCKCRRKRKVGLAISGSDDQPPGHPKAKHYFKNYKYLLPRRRPNVHARESTEDEDIELNSIIAPGICQHLDNILDSILRTRNDNASNPDVIKDPHHLRSERGKDQHQLILTMEPQAKITVQAMVHRTADDTIVPRETPVLHTDVCPPPINHTDDVQRPSAASHLDDITALLATTPLLPQQVQVMHAKILPGSEKKSN
ncbi:hypothetical protein NQ315_003302 [Exocentrus adspersus]|uniref:Envelope fusion protein n=1 Tax=Exocentrus adspersus TaxID=1586481 RepID=A0AAV8VB29_9CUCU|nr:hypothetical protein NQ315_003302 [Exocentrus adspersus]